MATARLIAGVFLSSFLGLCLAAGAGCESVDLGTPPADVNECHPGQQFFIDQIWPNFLSKDYGGKHCYDSSCHFAGSSTGFSIPPPTSAAAIPFPPDWAADYLAASNEMECSNVKASRLYTNPSGIVIHGGGMLIDPNGPELTLLEMWVTQP